MTIDEIKKMILDCDSNLRCSYYFDDNLIWYSKFYFGDINIKTEKVEFWRIYFDEICKKGYKTLYTEVPFSEITPDIVKEQVNTDSIDGIVSSEGFKLENDNISGFKIGTDISSYVEKLKKDYNDFC